jgi:hypothetical protein
MTKKLLPNYGSLGAMTSTLVQLDEIRRRCTGDTAAMARTAAEWQSVADALMVSAGHLEGARWQVGKDWTGEAAVSYDGSTRVLFLSFTDNVHRIRRCADLLTRLPREYEIRLANIDRIRVAYIAATAPYVDAMLRTGGPHAVVDANAFAQRNGVTAVAAAKLEQAKLSYRLSATTNTLSHYKNNLVQIAPPVRGSWSLENVFDWKNDWLHAAFPRTVKDGGLAFAFTGVNLAAETKRVNWKYALATSPTSALRGLATFSTEPLFENSDNWMANAVSHASIAAGGTWMSDQLAAGASRLWNGVVVNNMMRFAPKIKKINLTTGVTGELMGVNAITSALLVAKGPFLKNVGLAHVDIHGDIKTNEGFGKVADSAYTIGSIGIPPTVVFGHWSYKDAIASGATPAVAWKKSLVTMCAEAGTSLGGENLSHVFSSEMSPTRKIVDGVAGATAIGVTLAMCDKKGGGGWHGGPPAGPPGVELSGGPVVVDLGQWGRATWDYEQNPAIVDNPVYQARAHQQRLETEGSFLAAAIPLSAGTVLTLGALPAVLAGGGEAVAALRAAAAARTVSGAASWAF